MGKNIIKLSITSIVLQSTLFANFAIVNTDILLIKKTPSIDSITTSYHKRNEKITLIKNQPILGNNKELWYKIENGYVNANYIILENNLPKSLTLKDIDPNKNAIQLISYNINAVQSLMTTRILLKNEKNIYIKNTSKHVVVYLVNFDSYDEAKVKSKNLKKYFPSNYVRKVKISQKNNLIEEKKSPIKLKVINKNINLTTNNRKNTIKTFLAETKYTEATNINNNDINEQNITRDYISNGFEKKKTKVDIKEIPTINKKEIINKKEKIILENKIVLKRPDISGKENLKNLEKETNTSTVNSKSNIPSYGEMLENILIELNK